MMDSHKTGTSSAWENDWTSSASGAAEQANSRLPKMSQKERLRKHREDNKKLWASAEESATFHFLEMQHSLPPHALPNFRGAPKVLSRRPDATKGRSRTQKSPLDNLTASGMTGRQSAIGESDDEDDSPPALTAEERKALAGKELEAKQERYRAARERILGSSSPQNSKSLARQPRGNERQSNDRKKGMNESPVEDLSDFVRSESTDQRQLQQLPSGPMMNPLAAEFKIKEVPAAQRRGHHKPPGSAPSRETNPIRQPRGPDAEGRGFAQMPTALSTPQRNAYDNN